MKKSKTANRRSSNDGCSIVVKKGETLSFPVAKGHRLAACQDRKAVKSLDDVAEFGIVREYRKTRRETTAGAVPVGFRSDHELLYHLASLGEITGLRLGDFIVESGAKVVLTAGLNSIEADRVVIAGTLECFGHLTIKARELRGGSGDIIVYSPDGCAGDDHGGDAPPTKPNAARAGADAVSEIEQLQVGAQPGGGGTPGSSGTPGGRGGAGIPGHTVTGDLGTITSPLTITVIAGKGGPGGNGGPGGQGGDGGRGGNAVHALPLGGQGGDGGTGGSGGSGGTGGNGGSGGTIDVTVHTASSAAYEVLMFVEGGMGGAAGYGGRAGIGGSGGGGGTSYAPFQSDSGRHGATGDTPLTAPPGSSGQRGTASIHVMP